MTRPRTYVDSPTFTPLPYGLLSTLATNIRQPSDHHWLAGVQYESLCANASTTFDDCVSVTGSANGFVVPAPTRTETTSYTQRGATPFTVYTEIDCSAPGFWDRMESSVNESFTQSEQRQVEQAFWTGVAGGQNVVYPHLAANAVVTDSSVTLQTAATTVVSGSAPLDIVEAMGRIQGELAACYDGVGIIHVPRSLEPALSAQNLIINEGFRYRTPQGNIVVLGAGYTGSSPAGVLSDSSKWIYATGAMFIYRGPMRTTTGELFDRDNNLAKAMAERSYVLGWDCCHLAVNVTMGGEIAGTAGAAT